MDVTIITPCAPAHVRYLDRCKASVRGLTTPALHLIGIDHTKRGAGAVRNALLMRVTTPYVVFLDADDTISPNYLDKTLPYIKPKSYVYTGWYEGHNIKYPAEPKHIWNMTSSNPTWHVVTCLFNTNEVISAGGFDTTMRGQEDKDLFLRLIRYHCFCPVRVNEPLMRYHYEQGQYSRSHEIRDTGEWVKINQLINERYGYKMACCGIKADANTTVGTRLEGDVLVSPLWGGNRVYYGRITGRKYGRVSRSNQFYCDPKDAQADRELMTISDIPHAIGGIVGDDLGIEILDPDISRNLSDAQKMAMAYGMNVPVVPMAKEKPSGKPDIESIIGKRKAKGKPKADELPVASDDPAQFLDK